MRISQFYATRLAHVMWVIAVFAVTLTTTPDAIKVEFFVLILITAFIVTIISTLTSSSWINIAAWVTAFYPVCLLLSLYITWLTAWFKLGHRPRTYLDDPNTMHRLIGFPHSVTWLLISGAPPALIGCIMLMLINAIQTLSRKPARIAQIVTLFILLPLVWLSTILISRWDPGGAVTWFMD